MKKKVEFSKIIFIGVSILNIVVVTFTLIIIWKTNDTSPLAYLIPACFAEFATATGFYYSKAKVENKIKLKQQYKMPLEAEDFKEDRNENFFTGGDYYGT